MQALLPVTATAIKQPVVELTPVLPAPFTDFYPNSMARVLHVLLNDALLPACRHRAEFGLEQVVAAHHFKAGVDGAQFAEDTVNRGLHVVVDDP